MIITRVIFLYGLSEELWFNSFFFARFQKKKTQCSYGSRISRIGLTGYWQNWRSLLFRSFVITKSVFLKSTQRHKHFCQWHVNVIPGYQIFTRYFLILVYFVNWFQLTHELYWLYVPKVKSRKFIDGLKRPKTSNVRDLNLSLDRQK